MDFDLLPSGVVLWRDQVDCLPYNQTLGRRPGFVGLFGTWTVDPRRKIFQVGQ